MKKYLFALPVAILAAAIIVALSGNVNPGKYNSTAGGSDKIVIADTFFPNDNQVCFYEHENFGGKQICISSSGEITDLTRHYIEGTSSTWDNKISSVIIGKNGCAFIYEHPNGGGYCLVLRGNGASQRRIPKLSTFQFNDKASHIRSYAYPDNYPPDPGDNEVFFFEHKDYDGNYMTMQISETWGDLSKPPYAFFNDKISSIKLGANTCLTAWNDANFKGKRSQYRASGSSLWRIPDLAPTGVGDKWSSLKVRHRDNCDQ